MTRADDLGVSGADTASEAWIARRFFGNLSAETTVGVAVSGGSDSIATLRILAPHGRIAAVTVDHGLRAESLAEARFVGETCARFGVPHDILRWSGPMPTGNLMDQARRARLALIGEWAAQRGIHHVVLGHTSDDQAETFLMRVARSSGLEGLTGMRPRFDAQGVTWHRPFLGVSRECLRDHLRAIGQSWIDDPSNDNTRFDRVKIRNALKKMPEFGISAEAINVVIENLSAAESALQSTLADLAARYVVEDRGDICVDAAAFRDAMHPEMRRRLMNAALLWVSRADYAPRAAKLAGFLAAPRDCTLHGCRLSVDASSLRIAREANSIANLRVAADQIWDRWMLTCDTRPPDDAQIGALGEAGLKLCSDWRSSGLPRSSLLASPALWLGENLLCAPLAGVENGYKARIACDGFAESLIRR
jgi:tRNA(Ile)-lysidine synthase